MKKACLLLSPLSTSPEETLASLALLWVNCGEASAIEVVRMALGRERFLNAYIYPRNEWGHDSPPTHLKIGGSLVEGNEGQFLVQKISPGPKRVVLNVCTDLFPLNISVFTFSETEDRDGNWIIWDILPEEALLHIFPSENAGEEEEGITAPSYSRFSSRSSGVRRLVTLLRMSVWKRVTSLLPF